MYIRSFIAILALIGTTLACSYPGMAPNSSGPSDHLDVVNPLLIENGDITFDLTEATSDSEMTPGWGCWPPHHNKEGSDSDITGSFTVSPPSSTSRLDGKCSSNDGVKAVLTGTIYWDRERIEFNLVVTSSSQLNIIETFHGDGSFVSSTRAEGLASWSLSCAEKGTGYTCFAKNASGSVPWTMTFTP